MVGKANSAFESEIGEIIANFRYYRTSGTIAKYPKYQ